VPEDIVEDVVSELDVVPTDEPSIEPEVVEAEVVEPEVVEAEVVEVIAQEFAIEVFPEIYSFEGEYVEEESAE
jgi:hypothetical protein